MSRFDSLTSIDEYSSLQSGGFMSRFSSYLNTKTLIFIGALVIFIIVAVFVYNKYFSPSTRGLVTQPENGSGSTSSQREAELLFFHTTWCPHCKTAKPIWDDLKAEYENKTIKGYKIIFTDINCTDESAEVEMMLNKFKVEGYPTIKLIHNGQVIEYDAKPSRDTLLEFLNTVL